jgi:hypothetical protein
VALIIGKFFGILPVLVLVNCAGDLHSDAAGIVETP